MTTTVAYHADHHGPDRPAINVKCYGQSMLPQAFLAASDESDGPPWSDYIEYAYEDVQADFWQAAAEIAIERGLGEIEQEGRSGGWLVLTSPTVPSAVDEAALGVMPATEADDPDYLAGWLTAYSALAAWCEAEVAAAPARVAERAQQLAMDDIGEQAARRFFPARFFAAETWTIR